MSIAEKLKARYTDERIKALSCEGHPLLSKIARVENWCSPSLAVPFHGKMVSLRRACDYERVRFSKKDSHAKIFSLCDRAIRALGSRMESCLSGKRIAKKFTGEIVSGGLDPIARWEGEPVTLYSTGPCPMLSDSDGECVLRVMLNPEAASQDIAPEYGELLEVRFVYYANTGPSGTERKPMAERQESRVIEGFGKAA